LTYNDIYTLVSTSGLATYEYSGNGAVSPDPAAPSLQPLYWDRYAGIYDKYVVLGSSIEMKVTVDTGSNQCVSVALFPYYLNDVTTSHGGIREACEMPYSRHQLLVNHPVDYKKMSLSMQTGTLLTTTPQALQNDPDYWAETVSLPTREWFYKIIAGNVDATVTSFGLAMEVIVKYDVVFKQWKDEAPSRIRAPPIRHSSSLSGKREAPECVIVKQEEFKDSLSSQSSRSIPVNRTNKR
jgi:hypothetical protein